MNPALDSLVIRNARPEDFETISVIYEQNVLLGTGSFEIIPPSTEEMLSRYHKVLDFGGVYLVAELDHTVIGYAYAGPYNTRAAYFNTAEDSIYLHQEVQGMGIGKVLLKRLLDECEKKGFRQMIACIGDSKNYASIGLHKSLGFEPAGLLKNVGYKFDRWLDSVFMQKTLGKGAEVPPTRKDKKV